MNGGAKKTEGIDLRKRAAHRRGVFVSVAWVPVRLEVQNSTLDGRWVEEAPNPWAFGERKQRGNPRAGKRSARLWIAPSPARISANLASLVWRKAPLGKRKSCFLPSALGGGVTSGLLASHPPCQDPPHHTIRSPSLPVERLRSMGGWVGRWVSNSQPSLSSLPRKASG